jgi:hypothetical protein
LSEACFPRRAPPDRDRRLREKVGHAWRRPAYRNANGSRFDTAWTLRDDKSSIRP